MSSWRTNSTKSCGGTSSGSRRPTAAPACDAEARRAARLAFGNPVALRERAREPYLNGSFKLHRAPGEALAGRQHGAALAGANTALIEAGRRFRRVRGYKTMPALIAALCADAVTESGVLERVA